jgi:hypothetical protein
LARTKFVFADRGDIGLSTGQQKTVTFSHDGSGPPPCYDGVPTPRRRFRPKTLVNDLDLTVVDASGRTYYLNAGSGLGIRPTTWSRST